MYEVKEEDLKLSSNFEKANQKILKKKEEIMSNIKEIEKLGEKLI